MVRAVASLRAATLAVLSLVVFDVAAVAQSIPPSKASRELVRRMLLDACVYQENAKEEPSSDDKPIKPDVISARQQKIVDACQCASARAVKPVKDEDIAKVDETRQVPDAWYAATSDSYGACRR
ncbi:MAG: hypothetical protein GX458_12180 [Phyllobacteriaceae bacterium]|nr:hypothetical protein [Phyllobacteriaceae bacterium]